MSMILMAVALPPCPETPNCVSTQATDFHRIAPLPYRGTRQESRKRLLAVLQQIPRTKIVAADEHSIRTEFRTLVFRFVDDGLFVFDDEAGCIQFRSASRVGSGDLGVNRKRMERIRAEYLADQTR